MSPNHDHISRWHLVEHFPSILNAPTFPIYVNQAKMSLIMFEIQVPFFLQQEIQIKLNSHVHIKGTNIIFIRTKKAALTFSISQIAFTYLLQPYSTIPPVQRT
jgi:hypothetical protein